MKRELLDNGNIWQKSDGRWIGMVRYKDEFGVAQRKSFSSKKKKTLQAKRKTLNGKRKPNRIQDKSCSLKCRRTAFCHPKQML